MTRLTAVERWGSTPAERTAHYPCDELIDPAGRVVFRAVDIDAPSGLVFRWLCQLRVGPYSYDWIDNRGRRSPRRLIDGLEQLEDGQNFMTIFRLVSFEDGRSITLDSNSALFGRVAGTYLVAPKGLRRMSPGREAWVRGTARCPRTIATATLARWRLGDDAQTAADLAGAGRTRCSRAILAAHHSARPTRPREDDWGSTTSVDRVPPV